MAISDTATHSTADERVGATQRAIESRVASAFAESMQVNEYAPDIFHVRTAGGVYFVDMRGNPSCSCPDGTHRTNSAAGVSCKHAYRIKYFYCDDEAGDGR